MRTCFEEICSAVDKAKIELEDMESELSFFQSENERLLTVCKRLDKEREQLAAENAELRDRVADYSSKLAALLSAKHLFLKQRFLLADVLEDVCIGHKTSGACPLFYRCPAGDLGKSCGELTKEDWIHVAIEVANGE